MKLFARTLLFFIGVIAFQSVLTFLFVTNMTRRGDLAEAERELEGEAALLLDGFNSWKRQLWISLVHLGQNVPVSIDDPSTALVELMYTSKADTVILVERSAAAPRILSLGASTMDASDIGRLENRKTHPYLEFMVIRGTLHLIGVTGLSGTGPRRDAYLMKRIDQAFLTQLRLGRRSEVALYLGGRYRVGSFTTPPSWVFDPATLECAYLERYNERVGGERYNVALEWAGRLGSDEAPAQPGGVFVAGPDDLYLAVFLSNAPYAERILLVSRIVLLVSLSGGLLTIGLSLFLSRNITHPVAELVAAMERIAGGEYDTRVPLGGGQEIRRLSAGLNDMARELHHRREAMQAHIRETTLLKEYNERIIDSIRAGIAIVSSSGVVEKANDTFVRTFGLTAAAVEGRAVSDLGIDVIDASVLSALDSIRRRELEEHAQVKRAGDERVFEIEVYPFYGLAEPEDRASVLVVQDITSRTELEHKIYQAEKLSSITMLSAGMAHEINNPLGSILSNTQNLLAVETCEERRESLQWIEQETRRVARIVQELLRFAAPDTGHAPGAAVNGVIRDVVRLVGWTLGAEDRIHIETILGEDTNTTVLSPDELKQVVINLIKNSIQAIDGEGRITLTTRPRSGGRTLSLTIADTGRGIPKALLPRIFDPFFTTKANGVGTGLGLSVVYGIVTKRGGSIRVRSREGAGTRVTLELPREAET